MRNIPYKLVETLPSGRVRVRTINDEPSLTQQQFADETEVNKIVAKYQNTGEWLHLTRKQGIYADVSKITDYQQSLEKISLAEAAFSALPAPIRSRFSNDPGQLLAFLQDPKNREEGIKLGLYEKSEQTNDKPQTTITSEVPKP